MSIWLHLVIAPFASYFMTLFWVAAFGNTFTILIEKNAIEEFILCITIYVVLQVVLKLYKIIKRK